jgi:hypothetical protein
LPWSGSTFAKHNHSLSPAQASHASHIANHVLKSTGDEGEAIATANKFYQHRDQGGGIGGLAPNRQNQTPLMQNIIQRYAGLPTEKLAELAAQVGDSPQGNVINHLLMQRRMQPANAPDPSQQQQAAPVQQKRGGETPKRAGGGPMGLSSSEASPWWTRRDATTADASGPSLGFLHGPTPGRADAIDTTAPAGSHVIPADVVAGLGEGNSLAGAARMQQVINTGPHGIPLPRGGRGSGPPRPPRAPQMNAKGGNVGQEEEPENTPVMLSHGEYVVHPDDVKRWGKGDQKAGHEAWDAWIVHERKKQIKKLQKLRGPVKS